MSPLIDGPNNFSIFWSCKSEISCNNWLLTCCAAPSCNPTDRLAACNRLSCILKSEKNNFSKWNDKGLQGFKFSCFCRNSCSLDSHTFIFSLFWRLLAQIHTLFQIFFLQASLHSWVYSSQDAYGDEFKLYDNVFREKVCKLFLCILHFFSYWLLWLRSM